MFEIDTMAQELINKSKQIRLKILKLVKDSNASHIGSMFSCVDLLVYLYNKQMNFSKENYKSPDRDIFILSKGHASLTVYAVLSDIGILPKKDLDTYHKDGGKLIGHFDHKVPGVEASTGSLGHGLPIAAGIALANKMNKSKSKVYCLIGDGECNEGSIWESFMFMKRSNLGNLTVIIDANKLQGYDYCDEICESNMLKRMLKATDLNFFEIDGHNFDEIKDVFKKIEELSNGKSSIIFANTIKGKGVSFMEDKLEWHYKSPDDSQYKIAEEELK